MGKSIYSLVLNDEVVDLIDNAAYKRGVSRSTLVNEVLAKAVGYQTTEMQIKSIFSLIDNLIESERRMRLLEQNRDSGFSIVSALNYKYSPRITYAVEIKPRNNILGELSISFRTSKPELISAIEKFFAVWIATEKSILPYEVEYFISEGKLKRVLYEFDEDESASAVANNIVSYVKNMDKLLNLYVAESEYTRDELLISRIKNLEVLI